MRTLCRHITLHSFLVPHLWLKVHLIVCPKRSFHFISLARCLLLRTEHPALHPRLFPLFQVSRGCSHPEFPAGDGFSDPVPRTGYEPNRIADNQVISEEEDISSTEDNQSSTQGSIVCIATPQEADLDDVQIRALLASPWYLPEREASAERSQVYHSEREGLMSSSSRGAHFRSAMPTARTLHTEVPA